MNDGVDGVDLQGKSSTSIFSLLMHEEKHTTENKQKKYLFNKVTIEIMIKTSW